MKLIDGDALREKIWDALNNDYMTLGEGSPYINYDYINSLIDRAPGFKWASMEEDPPKCPGFYLCHYKDLWDDGEDVATMYFNGETFGLAGLNNNEIKVLHWMPALWPEEDSECNIQMSVYMTKEQLEFLKGIRDEQEKDTQSDRKPEDPL